MKRANGATDVVVAECLGEALERKLAMASLRIPTRVSEGRHHDGGRGERGRERKDVTTDKFR